MSGAYDDIIHLSRPVSKKHRPMPACDRAAQFSPFAALTGHDAAIRETERLTDEDRELGIDAQRMLDGTIREIRRQLEAQPTVRAVYFEPDERKRGGAFRTVTGTAVRVDAFRQVLVFADGQTVPFSRLRELEIEKRE